MWTEIGMWIFLLWNTVTDVKSRKIHVEICIFFGCIGMIMFFGNDERDILSLVSGMSAGIYLLFFAFFTKEAVGWGDGFVVMATGIWLKEKTLGILMGAFVLAAVFGVFRMMQRKADRKSELPFVPFFFLSYVIGYAGGLL